MLNVVLMHEARLLVEMVMCDSLRDSLRDDLRALLFLKVKRGRLTFMQQPSLVCRPVRDKGRMGRLGGSI